MASIPTADFTTHDVNLRLTQNSVTPVVFTFTGINFTGYTSPRTIWCNADETVKALITTAVTDAVNGEITVTFDSTAWTAIGSELGGEFQLEITDPSANLKILAIGSTVIEASKTYP